MDLPPKQARFVSEYIKSRNGQDAAIKAGYSPKTARVQAAQLLAKPNIQAAVQAEFDAAAEASRITVARLLREIGIIAFSDLGDVMDFRGEVITEMPAREMSPEKRRTIQSVKITTKTTAHGRGDAARTETTRTVEYRLWDKTAALEKLAKHFGLFLEQGDLQALRDKLNDLIAKVKASQAGGSKESPP